MERIKVRQMQLKRKIIIEGNIKLLTGLHIGGSEQEIKIGGVDNPVIKTGDKPYIPGSSLKGKLRSLLEKKEGKESVCSCGGCNVCRLFGTAAEKAKEPGRLIVRDSQPLDSAKETEVKFENTIDRVTSKAEHPRQTERVPAGNKFGFQIVYNDYGDDLSVFESFKESLKLLENDYIGGSGTRGYGRIELIDLTKEVIDFSESLESDENLKKEEIKNLEELKYN